MLRISFLVLAVLILSILAGTFIPASNAAEIKNATRVDYDGSFLTWIYHECNGWNLNALASTDGWAQIETGPTVKINSVLVQPLLGVAVIGNPIEEVTVSPQLFAFYENDNWDIGSWNVPTFGKLMKPSFYYRDFLVKKGLIGPVGIGWQMEGIFQSQKSGHAYGLRLRYDFAETIPFSLFAARTFDNEWTYRLTLMKFF